MFIDKAARLIIKLLFGFVSADVCQTQPKHQQILRQQCCLHICIGWICIKSMRNSSPADWLYRNGKSQSWLLVNKGSNRSEVTTERQLFGVDDDDGIIVVTTGICKMVKTMTRIIA